MNLTVVQFLFINYINAYTQCCILFCQYVSLNFNLLVRPTLIHIGCSKKKIHTP